MKTNRIRLLAIVIAVAAITGTTAITAEAQRRESQSRTPVEKKEDQSVKNTVERKSTFREHDSARRGTGRTTVESKERVPQKSAQTPSREGNKVNNRQSQPPVASPETRGNERRPSQSNSAVRERENPSVQNRERNSQSVRNNSQVQNRNANREPVRQSREAAPDADKNRYSNSSRNSGSNATERVRPRTTFRNSREKYNLDRDDQRYSVTRNYKGKNETWSSNYRSNHRHYSNFNKKYYKNYNYHSYNHWYPEWSNYRWNVNSWIDYYNGYHPYSYTFHRHYFHHPVYGHVIRKFRHHPDVFVINNRNYYVYDGHFFRYKRGVGYVLVDVPYGLVVNYLPHNYDRVYINGFPYYRVGNLFFENSEFGFRLVHYPERYFAYMDDFHHNGYYFEDTWYY